MHLPDKKREKLARLIEAGYSAEHIQQTLAAESVNLSLPYIRGQIMSRTQKWLNKKGKAQ